jgi:hypothetical protein
VDYLPAHPNVDAKVPTLKPEKGGFKAVAVSFEEMSSTAKMRFDTYQDLFVR